MALAFKCTGVEVPVAVVLVPPLPEPFETPEWDPSHAPLSSVVISSGTVFRLPRGWQAGHPDIVEDAGVGKTAFVKAIGRNVRPWLSPAAIESISRAQRTILRLPETPPPLLPSSRLDLSGLVFTSIFNLSDRRKNASDLLSAFLTGLPRWARRDPGAEAGDERFPRKHHQLQELRRVDDLYGDRPPLFDRADRLPDRASDESTCLRVQPTTRIPAVPKDTACLLQRARPRPGREFARRHTRRWPTT